MSEESKRSRRGLLVFVWVILETIARSGMVSLKLRFFIGPGSRVYIALEGDTAVILLCGGDKGSQDGDIETAKAFWKDYQRSKTHENG